ncbi:MAG: hypothetical protein P4L92_11735 [Rudaea sp.]|nr:hypothetical protein [Rudaea sp.]
MQQSKFVAEQELVQAYVEKLPNAARNRDTWAAELLLRSMIDVLRNRQPLPPNWADFLAEALEKAIAKPKLAGATLGLVPRRARPSQDGKLQRDRKMVIDLILLNRKGIPLEDSRGVDGAYTLVARQWTKSKPTVMRAWRDNQALLRKLKKVDTK